MLNKVGFCVENEIEMKFDSVQRKEASCCHGERGDWHRKGLETKKDASEESA